MFMKALDVPNRFNESCQKLRVNWRSRVFKCFQRNAQFGRSLLMTIESRRVSDQRLIASRAHLIDDRFDLSH